MLIIVILALAIIPWLTGTLIMTVFGSRKADTITTYVSGMLFLFLLLETVILASLKLDWSFTQVVKWITVLFAGIGVVSIPAAVIWLKSRSHQALKIDKTSLSILLPAVLIGVVFFLLMMPYSGNDCTFEIVNSILTSDRLYTVNAFTGMDIQTGLPIYNKTPVLTILYAYVCRLTALRINIIAGVLFPVFFYTLGISVVHRVASFITKSDKERCIFMWTYYLLLICGTYLPPGQLPSSTGFAVLREGYSGYAVILGIVLPFTVLMILNKKYLLGIVMLSSSVVLIQLDRLFFLGLDGIQTFSLFKQSGKVIGLYLIALFVLVFLYMKNNERFSISLIFSSVLIIPYTVTVIWNKMTSKKERVGLFIACMLLFLFASSFRLAEKAQMRWQNEMNEDTQKVINQAYQYNETPIIWAVDDMVQIMRQIDGSVLLSYGRDLSDTKLTGYSYEIYEDQAILLYQFMRYVQNPQYYKAPLQSMQEVADCAVLSDVNTIVMPLNTLPDGWGDVLIDRGFEAADIEGQYVLYHR